MSIDLYDVIEWDNCYFVMYSQDSNNDPVVHYIKPIISIESPKGEDFNFLSVKASRFGIQINDSSTHWAICLMDDFKNEILFEGLVPENNTIHTISISETKEITVHRYTKYLKLTIGTKYSIRTNKARSSKYTIVSLED
jgi:hypothetical protein